MLKIMKISKTKHTHQNPIKRKNRFRICVKRQKEKKKKGLTSCFFFLSITYFWFSPVFPSFPIYFLLKKEGRWRYKEKYIQGFICRWTYKITLHS